MTVRLMDSTIYHRQCKLREYVNRIKSLDSIISAIGKDPSDFCAKLRKKRLFVCGYMNIDDTTFNLSFKMMVDDYITRKSRYSKKDYTLYDICLRNLASRFKTVFANTGTHNILLAFYEYAERLPRYINVNQKKLSELSVDIDCYFRHYINVFFCYDVVINLLENYKTMTDMDQMICLETLINDILFLVNVILVNYSSFQYCNNRRNQSTITTIISYHRVSCRWLQSGVYTL